MNTDSGGPDRPAIVEKTYDLPRREVVLTMAGVMLAMFLSSLDQTVVATAMPRIIADIGGFDRYTWVTTAYLVSSTAMMPITGRLTDLYGRKWFYVFGIALFLAGSVLSGLSQSLNQLIMFRALQGIGGGVMMANAFIVIGDLFPPAERGKYQGLITANFGLASIMGPLLGGFITDTLSWHWVFFIKLPLGIPIIILFIKFFPEADRGQTKPSLDIPGLMALMLCVVPLMLGLSWGGVQYEWSSVHVMASLTIGVCMGMIFILIEARAKEPIIPLKLFRNRTVTLILIISFLAGFGMFGGTIFLPLFFQGVLGLSATQSGSFLMPMMAGMVVASILSGQALSRLGGHYKAQTLIGLIVMGVGIFLLSRMSTDTSYGTATLNMVVAGIGIGTALPLFTIIVQNAVPYNIMGVATSAVQFFRQIGITLGLAVMGALMASRYAARVPGLITDEVRQGLPAEEISAMIGNPQALMDPEALANLRDGLKHLGPLGEELLEQLIFALRKSLSMAISDVFLVGMALVAAAVLLTVFLKEIPLKKR